MRWRRQILVRPREQVRVGIFIFVLILFISSALLWSFFYYTVSLLEESISPQNIHILYPLKEKINFRNSDFLHFLAQAFNSALNKCRNNNRNE